MFNVASNYTLLEEAAGDSATILGGASIVVFGIHVEGAADDEINVFEGDGTTKIMDLLVKALVAGSTVFEIPFLADNGISITYPAGATVTVFHSNRTA